MEGTIDRSSRPITFTIMKNRSNIQVRYISDNPVPDTFKDGAETVVTGRFNDENIFEAEHIQAKCASKYSSQLESAANIY